MGKNIATGSKKPKSLDRQRASAQLPPLPKMYQMGIAKGAEIERERIIKLLEIWWETDQELEELIDIIKGEKG